MKLVLKARKLHYKTEFQGLPISVENRKGSIRRGTDPDGNQWETKFKIPYGYIRGTLGVDGDHVDVFIGSNPRSNKVFVVSQKDPNTSAYDEDKCFLGFDSVDQIKKIYRTHYDKPGFWGGVTEMGMDEFKQRLKDRKGRRLAYILSEK